MAELAEAIGAAGEGRGVLALIGGGDRAMVGWWVGDGRPWCKREARLLFCHEARPGFKAKEGVHVGAFGLEHEHAGVGGRLLTLAMMVRGLRWEGQPMGRLALLLFTDIAGGRGRTQRRKWR